MYQESINLCHIITGDLWAGAEVQAFSVIKGLNKMPYIKMRVIIFNDDILSSKISEEGVQTDIVDEKKENFITMILHVYNILKEREIDIIHTHGYKETLIGGVVSKLLNIKLVRTHHGKGMIHGSKSHRFIELINEKYLTSKLISVSYELKDILIKNKIKENKIKVIHNGIKAESVSPSNNEKVIRLQLQIGYDTLVVGTIGRIVSIKGHKYFLDGAKRVLDDNKEIIFVIVGNGPLINQMKKYAKSLCIDKYIRFTGFRDDAIDILNMFDIFVLTSLHEGIPITLLEAMCLGKPIIATNVGGIPEVIRNEFNGLLIPPRDSKAIYGALIKLLNNKKLRAKFSCDAKKDVQNKFCLNITVKETERLYREIL